MKNSTITIKISSPRLHNWQAQTLSSDVGFSAALVVGVLVILFAQNLQAGPDGYLYVFMIDDTIYRIISSSGGYYGRIRLLRYRISRQSSALDHK